MLPPWVFSMYTHAAVRLTTLTVYFPLLRVAPTLKMCFGSVGFGVGLGVGSAVGVGLGSGVGSAVGVGLGVGLGSSRSSR